MKKKILFIMMLIIALAGSYISTTNAARSAGDGIPNFTASPNTQDVTVGETLQIDAVIVGTPTPEVRWYKDDHRIYEDDRTSISFDGQRATLTISDVKANDKGTYKIIAENTIGIAYRTCLIFVNY